MSLSLEEFKKLSPEQQILFLFDWFQRNQQSDQQQSQDIANLDARIKELEKIIQEAGLKQKEIRDNIKRIGERMKRAVDNINKKYKERKKIIEGRLREINKTIKLIGDTRTKNSIIWKMKQHIDKIVKYAGDIRYQIGKIMGHLGSFYNKFSKAWYTVSIPYVATIYVPKIGQLIDSVKELYYARGNFDDLKSALNNLAKETSKAVDTTGELAQATKHLADQVGKLILDVGNMMKDMGEELMKIFESGFRLEALEIPEVTVIRKSEIVKERLYAETVR